MTGSVFIVAAERSGDDLGAALIRQLLVKQPGLDIHGIGGDAMASEGVSSDFDISPLSILGFTEALKAFPVVVRKVREAVRDIMAINPSAVVLIDSWGFMIRVAKALRRAGYEGLLIKYVAPQVFAMREVRAKVLARGVDHLMTIHSFDAHYFEHHGLDVTYVGNPMFDVDCRQGDGAGLRGRLNVSPHKPLIALLFGSRAAEIQRLTDPFADAVDRLRKRYPEMTFVSPVSSSVATQVKEAAMGDERLKGIHLLPESDKFDVFAAADAAIACSGTVTTQLACAGVPTVVGYRLSGLTYFVAGRLYKPNYISLVNIAADKPLMPEFVQGDCSGENLASGIQSFMEDPEKRHSISDSLKEQTDRMKGSGGLASARAAETVLSLISA